MLSLHDARNDLTLSLEFVEYTTSVEDDDYGWITTELVVCQGNKKFSSRGSYLTDGDLFSIVQWFESLAKRKIPERRILRFLEPNLMFHFMESKGSGILIGTQLNLEWKPRFKPLQSTISPSNFGYYANKKLKKYGGFKANENTLTFFLRRKDVIDIISQLKTMLSGLPDRSLSQI